MSGDGMPEGKTYRRVRDVQFSGQSCPCMSCPVAAQIRLDSLAGTFHPGTRIHAESLQRIVEVMQIIPIVGISFKRGDKILFPAIFSDDRQSFRLHFD